MEGFIGASVHKIDCDTKKTTLLFECIETIEEAYLLAQLAMCKKRDNELIFIMPGWNRSISSSKKETDREAYLKALELAEKYKPE